MTSKEALKKLNDKYIHSNKKDNEASKELHIIDKDLVVVEILKEYIYFDKKNNLIKMKEITKQWENWHYEILKEWLQKWQQHNK